MSDNNNNICASWKFTDQNFTFNVNVKNWQKIELGIKYQSLSLDLNDIYIYY